MCFIKEQHFNILLNVLDGFIYIQRPKQSFQTSDVSIDYVKHILTETFASVLNFSLCGLHVSLPPICNFLIYLARYRWVLRLV